MNSGDYSEGLDVYQQSVNLFRPMAFRPSYNVGMEHPSSDSVAQDIFQDKMLAFSGCISADKNYERNGSMGTFDKPSDDVACHFVLAGFMGVGKTATGYELSKLLGLEFRDLDQMLQQDFGMPAECFESEGEAWFRQRERNALEAAFDGSHKVIALGGGTLTNPDSLAILLSKADIRCVTLTAEMDDIMTRISDGMISPTRPLLPEPNSREAEARRLHKLRSEDYGRFDSVDTSGRTPVTVARIIADLASPSGPNGNLADLHLASTA